MTIALNPQEIFLLERYSSLAYFERMRDAFAACVKAADEALAEFMKNLPSDYRSRHVSHQPDAVWGELVIPNMRWTLESLNTGFINLSHGDFDALGFAGNVGTAFAGINREFSSAWMPEPFQSQYDANAIISSEVASNIKFTALGQWLSGELSTKYSEINRGPLDAPKTWPIYRLNPSIQVQTDQKVPRSGVYLPSLEGACAQFLIDGYDAWKGAIPDPPADPRITSAARTKFDTTWTLVERIADEGGGTPGEETVSLIGRCEGGKPCPRAGYWMTPAQQNSRRRFGGGELMPSLGGDYGVTIWQWDENQTP